MVSVLKHCIPSKSDLSPSLRMAFMAFSNSRSHVAALLGSVLMVLSDIGWISFKVLRRKLMCVNGTLNAFSRIDQALSIEVVPSGGMRSAVFPVRASRSLSNWLDFEILLSLTALLNLYLKVMKSSLGVPA